MSTIQRDLFSDDPLAAAPATGLFADVVFDRPLDHAYSYAVPDHLRADIAVGKRVLAPFGRGERVTVGYCVRVSSADPGRPVKEIRRVLDEDVLLTPNLLRLTRWIADYYLCGWGQVLNAVVPAGARQQAGMRSILFLEAVPLADVSRPPPRLGAKQQLALEQLRQAGKPVEARRLARAAGCGPGPLDALVEKGLARRVVRRVDQFALAAEEPATPEPAVTLNADQRAAWTPVEQALRQGGFHAFLLHGVTGSGKTEIYLRAI